MKQLLLPEAAFTADKKRPEITLGIKDTHYIKNVLRLREGDVFTAADVKGVPLSVRISRYENGTAVLIIEKNPENKENRCSGKDSLPEIVLFQALIRGSRMDLVVRQAVEAGVSAIVPVETENSFVKTDEKKRSRKAERWQKIVKEAFQQSGSSILTSIEKPCTLKEAFDKYIDRESQTSIFFHQKSIANKSLHQYLSADTERINLLTGPEGGLSEREAEWLSANSFKPAYLGSGILRAETASIYAIAAVKTILLEKKTWKTV